MCRRESQNLKCTATVAWFKSNNPKSQTPYLAPRPNLPLLPSSGPTKTLPDFADLLRFDFSISVSLLFTLHIKRSSGARLHLARIHNSKPPRPRPSPRPRPQPRPRPRPPLPTLRSKPAFRDIELESKATISRHTKFKPMRLATRVFPSFGSKISSNATGGRGPLQRSVSQFRVCAGAYIDHRQSRLMSLF